MSASRRTVCKSSAAWRGGFGAASSCSRTVAHGEADVVAANAAEVELERLRVYRGTLLSALDLRDANASGIPRASKPESVIKGSSAGPTKRRPLVNNKRCSCA